MSNTLKIFTQLGPDTNIDAFNGWLRGLPGVKNATFVREIDLELKDSVDVAELKRTLASCPFADVIDHDLLESAVGVTEDGLEAMAGAEVEQKDPPHEPQVSAHNADDVLLGWAEALNGREYRDELSGSEEDTLSDSGILLICGGSDDLMEVYGQQREEYDTGSGTTYFYWDGKEFVKDGTEGFEAEEGATSIVAQWCPEGRDLSWGFETDAPRWAKFEIMEDDDCYGEGLLVYVDDLKPKAEEVVLPDENEKDNPSEDGGADDAGQKDEDSTEESNGESASTESQAQTQDADVSTETSPVEKKPAQKTAAKKSTKKSKKKAKK